MYYIFQNWNCYHLLYGKIIVYLDKREYIFAFQHVYLFLDGNLSTIYQ